jgi:hypothetical protein
MEGVMAEVAHLSSVEQHITAAIKNSIDSEWIRCTGRSLHHQQIVNGVVIGLTRIYIPWWCKQAYRLKSETAATAVQKQKLTCIHMLLSQNSGTEYFVDDIVICSQGFYTRNLF